MALSMENVSWKIFGDGCVGHKCMDTNSCKTHYIEKSKKGVNLTYTVWDCIVQIEYFLVMFLRVPSIDFTCFPRTWV